MADSDSHNQSEAITDDTTVPAYRTAEQVTVHSFLQETLNFLTSLGRNPDRCVVCEKSTTRFLVYSLAHSLFRCSLPVMVCRDCARRYPFAARTNSLLPSAALMTLLVAVFAGLSGQFALCGVLVLCVGAVRVLFPEPFKSSSIPQAAFDDQIDTIPTLKWLRDEVPSCQIRRPREKTLYCSQQDSPASKFKTSLMLNLPVRFLCSFGDLNRSRIDEGLLDGLIRHVMRLEKEWLAQTKHGNAAAIQVAVAVLPDDKLAFDLEVRPQLTRKQRKAFQDQLDAIPPIPVAAPIVFAVRDVALNGWDRLRELPSPFCNWPLAETSDPAFAYSQAAMQVFQIESMERSVELSPERLHAWSTLLPDDAELGFRYVVSLALDGRVNESEVQLQQFLARHGDLPRWRIRYANALDAIGQTERAAAACSQLISRHKGFTDAYSYLAYLQLQLARPEDAAATLERAPTTGCNASYWFTAARVAEARQDVDKAITCLSRCLMKDLNFLPAYLARAELLTTLGKHQAALDDVDRYERLESPTPATIRTRVILLHALGRANEALEILDDAVGKFPDEPVLMYLRADTLVDVGKVEMAREACTALLQTTPDLKVGYELRARVHLAAHEPEQAIRDAEHAIEIGHETPTLLLYLAAARSMLDDEDGAFEDLTRACDLDPQNANTRFQRARISLHRDDSDAAAEDLTAAITLAPEWTQPLVARGFLELNQGQWDQAQADFDRALELDPRAVDAIRGKSLALEARGQRDAALALLDKALAIDPQHVACLLDRSRLMEAEHDLDAARQALDAALEATPDLIPALLSRAQLKMQQGDFANAKIDFDAILREHPAFMPALIGRSVTFDYQGEREQSQEDLDAAVQQSPEYAEQIEVAQLMLKAEVAFTNDRFDDVINAANQALEIIPDSKKALRARAAARWYTEEFVEAAQDYSTLLEDEEQPDASLLSARGQVYAELGDFELALEDLQSAVSIFRDNDGPQTALAYSLNGLGRTLVGLDRMQEAAAAFDESAALKPDNAWLQFNRGLMFMEQKNNASAAECFQRALELKNPALSPRKRLRAQGVLERLSRKDDSV
jgi:tetratricopeptide (TPR) repeat protein